MRISDVRIFYVPVSAATARRKAQALLSVFGTQNYKYWFSQEIFLGLMHLRGMECRAAAGNAEAFYEQRFWRPVEKNLLRTLPRRLPAPKSGSSPSA
jgi:hypothetical protein